MPGEDFFEDTVSVGLLASGVVAQNRQGRLPELPPHKPYRLEELQHVASANVIAILGGTLIDGTGSPPLAKSAIGVRGNRIVQVGKESKIAIPPDAMRRADGEAILPGLIDMHVHLNQGHDLDLFLAAGVTTVRDVGNLTAQIVPRIFSAVNPLSISMDSPLGSVRLETRWRPEKKYTGGSQKAPR